MGKAIPYPVSHGSVLCPETAVGRRSVALGPERPHRGSQLQCSGFFAPPYAGHCFSRSQRWLS